MTRTILSATIAAVVLVAGCSPPPPVPPPKFQLNPRNPEDPYGQTTDPYGQAANPNPQNSDPYGQDTQAAPNPAPEAPPVRPGEYPVARRTTNPNQVISPYEPYNVIDVEGFRSGQLARDPSNKKIFRVP